MMKTYDVEIHDDLRLVGSFEVEANNEEEAKKMAISIAKMFLCTEGELSAVI